MAERSSGRYRSARIGDIVNTLVLTAISLVFLFPIIWAILTSFKTRVDALAMPPAWIFVPTLEHYRAVWANGSLLADAGHSLFVAASSTAVGLLLGVPAAYALARFRIRGRNALLLAILSTRMIPPVTFIVPFFVVFTKLSLKDTLTGLVILHLTIVLGFVIWMMRSYFLEIPLDIEDAARMDGCSPLQLLLRVVLPLSTPGLATTAIFCFIFSWNEFLYAMVFTNNRAKTLPLGIYGWVSYEEVRWGELTAAAVLAMLPVVLFYLFVQKALVRGLTMGAVKG